MTAINIVQRPGEILVMTDGLGGLSTGTRNVGKVALLAHIPMLIACRGHLDVAHLMATRLAHEVDGFDDALQLLPTIARNMTDEVCSHFKLDVPHEIHFVGYSNARSRLEHHFLATTDSCAHRGRQP